MAEPTDPRTPATSEQETTVHPDTDRRDTAVLTDGSTGWTPQPAAAPAPRRRSPDLLALTAGVVFCLVAVLGLVGTSLPGWVFGGGFVAVVLVVAGVGLLVNELRKPRG
ncbi:hypothetical protein [Klenkia taihuensis]|uniref:Uncharacterized protein n=1 Tax=Klenkia taihuensis TaxID=1225127 RepID=A0A1I1JNE2_9ACTN|nr:hypothetical protein [Klenkia taihuensis]GHE10798.1 hypothetical protein GCM10011381_21480 [Klenkia taihuensis]SFC50107.1 hypothetical protein SAMN05661030_1134 [Klenkia taihuensis]